MATTSQRTAWVTTSGVERLFALLYATYTPNICQDRLGTNIAKVGKEHVTQAAAERGTGDRAPHLRHQFGVETDVFAIL